MRWACLRSAALPLIGGAGLVHAAINLDGTPAVLPVTEDDYSPIADPNTYIQDQHDCPLPCVDYANVHSWIAYLSVERLHRCQEPMLLQFAASQPLDDPQSTIVIRSCTLGNHSIGTTAVVAPMENPKRSSSLFRSSLDVAPACATKGMEAQVTLEVVESTGAKGEAADIAPILTGIQSFYGAADNCDEKFVFAYHKQTVAGVYLGEGMGKPSVASALEALTGRLQAPSSGIPSRTVAQLCGHGRQPERVFGIVVDTTGDLAAVQKTAFEWSKGKCAAGGHLRPAPEPLSVKVFDIAGNSTNSTLWGNTNGTSSASRLLRRSLLSRRAPAAKPATPKPNADGTCATHIIADGDTCLALAMEYGVTVEELEEWNKNTWAWTDCPGMLTKYNMCIGPGRPPMPVGQAGTECGPLVLGTQPPTNKSISLADLNPCPLKACCSNWGHCGVFSDHCDIHAPKGGGGPGSKEKGFQNTCVSGCGQEIKKNSGPPAAFQRIGYYESFGLDRECLWLKAKNANTDGSYTHMHWGFADINPQDWSIVINDTKKQWADFKALPNMKRILSLGGWAYSTEAATYNIIRSAILDHRDVFASNIAQFVQKEGIDGIDIDWEYPGAPDIKVNGQVIGQKTDGIGYLKFLTVLRSKVPSGKSISIAAPASFWYLKGFPIDRIAAVVDYIVYMTYDLHGQWDYNNTNAFESCPSGRCIRSHVNLTETRNSLSVVTKAGVPNNKIFVGESSYGRSFHMAQDGCWGPMCEFTGTRDRSDANPGRCTKTAGYLADAEIHELLMKEGDVRTFHDKGSNSDIMLYKGDYVSYMTPTTKDTRRADWKNLNFAGTVDWAVDLQSFTKDDMDAWPDLTQPGEGCRSGEDNGLDSGDLCEFTCHIGFCPESLCWCKSEGDRRPLPPEKPGTDNILAWDSLDVELNKLCKFACKYGYCPPEICRPPEPEESDDAEESGTMDYNEVTKSNRQNCQIFKDPAYRDASVKQCEPYCSDALKQAKEEGRTTNYGCAGFYPLDKPIPWEHYSGMPSDVAPGKCSCDNFLVNEIANAVLEAMPIIAEIGCYIIMSSLKLVLDVGSMVIPGGAGRALDAGLDMAATAAQMASYIYPKDQKPDQAFSWWLSPCGDTSLVPPDITKAFDILSQITDLGRLSFKPPQNIKKGSGRKGDKGNPNDRSQPRPMDKKPDKGKSGNGSGANKPNKDKPKCKIAKDKDKERDGPAKNMLRIKECVRDRTKITEMIITSLTYAPNARPRPEMTTCHASWGQACYHYSSAIRVNPQWRTLTCPPEAATPSRKRLNGVATATYKKEHNGPGWRDTKHRNWDDCHQDEYPPAYLLRRGDDAFDLGGRDKRGQLVRYLPGTQNSGAAHMWTGVCFKPIVKDMSDRTLQDAVARAPASRKNIINRREANHDLERIQAMVSVDERPEFSITKWEQPPARDDGLWDNPCWPRKITPNDPGFALLKLDPWYGGKEPPFKYDEAYDPAKKNGV